MRLAFVSPLPPAATGIADHTADVLRLLAPRHEIDVFHAQEQVDAAALPASCPLRPARELVARHRDRPYEVVVHQLGNNPHHAFVYDLLARAPGLLVLHDLVLFHSRAAVFTDSDVVRAWRRDPGSAAARDAARPSLEAWQSELLYSYPAQGTRLFEAHLGTVGDLLPYAYPLFRIPVEASRAVLVHNALMARRLREEVPGAVVLRVPQPAARVPVEAPAVAALRLRLGFRPDEVVVGCFGLVTREKRLDVLARALARAASRNGRLRLLVVGSVPDGAELDAVLTRAAVRGRTIVTGRVPFHELPLHLEAADVAVHLRYPTGGETSGALLRILAQGRPTIVSDLRNQAEIPDTAVRRVDLAREEQDLERAIEELAADPEARRRLGAAAASYAREAHSPGRVLAGWEDALELTRRAAIPPSRPWPAHWPRPEPVRP